MPPLPLVQGTLDLLVLRTLASGPSHGYGVATAVHERTGGDLAVEDAALYQALHRLDRKGLVHAEWRQSENNRRARYYELTPRAASGCGRRWPTGGVIPAPSRRCCRASRRRRCASTILHADPSGTCGGGRHAWSRM